MTCFCCLFPRKRASTAAVCWRRIDTAGVGRGNERGDADFVAIAVSQRIASLCVFFPLSPSVLVVNMVVR